MIDVRTHTKEVLESLFPSEIVFAERYASETPGKWPDEYIVFDVVSDVDAGYADDCNVLTSTSIDVKWFGKSLNMKAERCLEIVRAMKAAGFRPHGRGRDISRDSDAVYYGATMEFLFQQVNFNG